MATRPVLLSGEWRDADASDTFQALCPATGETLPDVYPVSTRRDLEAAVDAGYAAAQQLLDTPAEKRAAFLDRYAERIEARADEIAEAAHEETALPLSPRLRDVELGRTTGQLRQAAAAVRDGSWVEACIDTASGIRSCLGALGGPVAVFGPNNFPLAFNAISGGDFAAAIAAGNPVIAKAHSSHPRTSRLLAEEAFAAVRDVGLPAATVQMVYRMSHDDGAWLVSCPRIAATGYTGSRAGGLFLKRAADAAGKPIYLELSSVNPVYVLPEAVRERGEAIAAEYAGSVLLGAGQFCTNPGILLLVDDDGGRRFVEELRRAFEAAAPGVLLGPGVARGLVQSVEALRSSGAEVLSGGAPLDAEPCRVQNTLLSTTGAAFLADPEALQREAFGNAALVVFAADADQLVATSEVFEGNLTGCLYTDQAGADDALYDRIVRHLRQRVGRLLNDKMPTGVAVSAAMNHGGPFPATGHPGFTAVGIPGSIRRFAMLQCYDNVRSARLPPVLRDANPDAKVWRRVDGEWTRDDVTSAASS